MMGRDAREAGEAHPAPAAHTRSNSSQNHLKRGGRVTIKPRRGKEQQELSKGDGQ